ncbi:MAG: disulfide bond formation protein B [Alphaproteobacteria bacterium]
MQQRLTPAAYATIMLILALGTVAAAWGFQLIGGYLPCKLCIQERLPYYAAIAVLAVALGTAAWRPDSRLVRPAIALAGLVFLVGVFLGGHHAGVEYGWWAGPSDCGTAGGATATTAEQLLQQLEGIRIVSCSEASWRFPAGWGPSFAGWNALLSIALVAIAIAGLRARPGARRQ